MDGQVSLKKKLMVVKPDLSAEVALKMLLRCFICGRSQWGSEVVSVPLLQHQSLH